MAKVPSMQFYPGDWLKDPAVSRCTPATRGIWMDLICAMHENDRSGEVSGTIEQLARIARCTDAEASAAVEDLAHNNAASVTRNALKQKSNGLRSTIVTLRNRRMYRAAKERKNNRTRQLRHRSKAPNGEVTDVSRSVNGASDNKVTFSSSSSSSPSGLKDQDIGGSVANVTRISQTRLDEIEEAAFNAFVKAYPPDGVKSILTAQRAWTQTTGRRPPLAALLEALDRHKRSRQWKNGRVPNVDKWLLEEQWAGEVGKGEASDGGGRRYKDLG